MPKIKKNRWKEHHDHLEATSKNGTLSKASAAKTEIMRMMGWSNPTFYRKLDTPEKLSLSEKITIANIYDMPIHFLFPECENEPA